MSAGWLGARSWHPVGEAFEVGLVDELVGAGHLSASGAATPVGAERGRRAAPPAAKVPARPQAAPLKT
jgi:hypothetical protein